MEFLNPNCSQTLQEGLDELYSQNPHVAATSKLKGKSFQDHDVTHVIFGCDTSIRGELILKPWILFGTDITRQEIADYMNDEEVKRLNKEGFGLMGGAFIATLKLMHIVPQFFITCFLRVRKMNKKWPHAGVSVDMFNARIVDLRNEYGIQLTPAKPNVSAG